MGGPVSFRCDEDGVGWVVFDAPGSAANFFNQAVMDAFAAALEEAGKSSARALVITSAKERVFIAGADLNWVAGMSDAAAAEAFSRRGQELVQRVAEFPVPVIAAIHGACVGAGFELALACHGRIASEDAVTRIGLPETTLGTIPGWGGTFRLPRLIGAQRALEHMLKSELVGATEARRLGLVDEIVPVEELRQRAHETALRRAESGTPARDSPAEIPALFPGDPAGCGCEGTRTKCSGTGLDRTDRGVAPASPGGGACARGADVRADQRDGKLPQPDPRLLPA